MLEIRNLSVNYKKKNNEEIKALSSININIKEGEILGVVGESGSGKTTIAKAILRLLPLNTIVEGEVFLSDLKIDDNNIDEMRGKKIAYITQSYYTSLSTRFNIGKQFDLILRSDSDLNKNLRKSKMLYLLSKLNFDNPKDLLSKYPFELSGGMLQRVIIAMAISQNPVLLIADEPTSSIDAITKSKLLELLMEISIKTKISILLISHDLALVHNFADTIAVTYQGFILECGDSKEIYNNPKHPYTELLINSKPDFNKKILEEKVVLREKSDSDCLFHQYCRYFSKKCMNNVGNNSSMNSKFKCMRM